MKITLTVNSSDANNIFASSYNVKTGIMTIYKLELGNFGCYDVIRAFSRCGNCVTTGPAFYAAYPEEILFSVSRATSALGKLVGYLESNGAKVKLEIGPSN